MRSEELAANLFRKKILEKQCQKIYPKPEKSIKQVEKEQLKRLRDKKTKLMLDK